MKFYYKKVIFKHFPLHIWTLKVCNKDISKIIIARSFKLGQLIKDEKLTTCEIKKKSLFA